MFKKEVLLSNFIKKNKILSYLEYIHNVFSIPYYNLFVYNIDDKNDEYVVTFKISATNKKIIKEIKGSSILHYKKKCLFSINALNKLIESKYGIIENTKDVEINWDDYENKLVLLKNDELVINSLDKIEDKTTFFK